MAKRRRKKTLDAKVVVDHAQEQAPADGSAPTDAAQADAAERARRKQRRIDAQMLAALHSASREELERFRKQRLGRDSDVSLERMHLARNMLDLLVELLRDNNDAPWNRLDGAIETFHGRGSTDIPPPPASDTGAFDDEGDRPTTPPAPPSTGLEQPTDAWHGGAPDVTAPMGVPRLSAQTAAAVAPHAMGQGAIGQAPATIRAGGHAHAMQPQPQVVQQVPAAAGSQPGQWPPQAHPSGTLPIQPTQALTPVQAAASQAAQLQAQAQQAAQAAQSAQARAAHLQAQAAAAQQHAQQQAAQAQAAAHGWGQAYAAGSLPNAMQPGAMPQGAMPQGAVPQGAVPQGAVPQGAVPQGAGPQGAGPQGAGPQGAMQQGAGPQGAMQPGAMQPGAMQPSAMQPSAMHPGAMLPGALLQGATPPGAMPAAQMPGMQQQQHAPMAGAQPASPTQPGPHGMHPHLNPQMQPYPSNVPLHTASAPPVPSAAVPSAAVPSAAVPSAAVPSGVPSAAVPSSRQAHGQQPADPPYDASFAATETREPTPPLFDKPHTDVAPASSRTPVAGTIVTDTPPPDSHTDPHTPAPSPSPPPPSYATPMRDPKDEEGATTELTFSSMAHCFALSVDEYAALCAERDNSEPELLRKIEKRYDITTPPHRRALQQTFNSRFDRDPSLRERWEQSYTRYSTLVRARRKN